MRDLDPRPSGRRVRLRAGLQKLRSSSGVGRIDPHVPL